MTFVLLNMKVLIVFCALVAAANAKFRVINGHPARQGQWPFAVYLPMGCSGSVINQYTILSAGHCLNGPISHVVVGAVNGRRPDYGARTYRVARTIRHPRYKGVGGDDFLIVKLAEPIQYDRNQRSIEIDCTPVRDNDVITIVGYGMTNLQDRSAVGVLYYATNRAGGCKGPTGSICQLATVNTPIFGDSGGPLIMRRGGAYKQVGVVSGGQPMVVAFYANVATNCAWIRQNM